MTCTAPYAILAGPDGFFRPCSRHRVRPSYGDFVNSFAIKARAGPYGSYDNLIFNFFFLIYHMTCTAPYAILAGPDGFFRPCSRHRVRPSYGDFVNSFAIKARAGPYGSYDNLIFNFFFLIYHMTCTAPYAILAGPEKAVRPC